LALGFPATGRFRLPLTRDQIMLLISAVNELFLGIDIYLAHSISGTIVPREWIPIIFGPIAAAVLLILGLVAQKKRMLAATLATLIFLLSIAVGLLGAYFHVVRAILPAAPIGEEVSIPLLVWAPPILGPLTFSLVGLIGISAAWVEQPSDSGTILLVRGHKLGLPLSKTRAYLLMVGLGSLATLISSVLDHARTGFVNNWLWIPTIVGVIGTVAAIVLGFLDKPSRSDVCTYVAAMGLMLVAGLVGSFLHIQDDLTAQGTFILERFIRGAPVLAPLLFCNMSMIGLVALLNPHE